MFQMIFGDDEHTSQEGPYKRLMKARKWLYVTSGVAILMRYGLYHEAAALTLLKIFALPNWIVKNAVAASLAYLLGQFFLLLTQLVAAYPSELADRFTLRRVDEIAAVTGRLEQARGKIRQSNVEMETFEARRQADVQSYLNYDYEARAREVEARLATEEADSLAEEVEKLRKREPSQSRAYQIAEVSIDALRLASPLVFGCVALLMLLFAR